jgi:hypothetical protein
MRGGGQVSPRGVARRGHHATRAALGRRPPTFYDVLGRGRAGASRACAPPVPRAAASRAERASSRGHSPGGYAPVAQPSSSRVAKSPPPSPPPRGPPIRSRCAAHRRPPRPRRGSGEASHGGSLADPRSPRRRRTVDRPQIEPRSVGHRARARGIAGQGLSAEVVTLRGTVTPGTASGSDYATRHRRRDVPSAAQRRVGHAFVQSGSRGGPSTSAQADVAQAGCVPPPRGDGDNSCPSASDSGVGPRSRRS